ncbi:MAG: HAMP domain-containing sensor histidine kinase [Kofleriaceae bacterium]
MRVRTRLILLGAVVPVCALLALAVVAGLVLSRRLHLEVDELLLAQAAAESVGLFDGPTAKPHLHAHRSPLRAGLHGVIPVGAIYEESGDPVVRTHPTEVPERLRNDGAVGSVVLRTVPARDDAPERRELISPVLSPEQVRYTLYLAVAMTRVDSTMNGYWFAALLAVLGVASLLSAVQLWMATRMARRIGSLHAYLPRLREGQSEPPPPEDLSRDELAALRDGLYQAARELERSRAQRERGLADAAHDLRTPLGIIRVTIDLALRKPRAEGELRAALAEIRRECERLTALTSSILAQRRGDRVRSRVDVRELMRAAAKGISPLAAEAGVELRVDGRALSERPPGATGTGAPPPAPGPAALPHVLGDPLQLRRILDNLLHNAVNHSPRGGRVHLNLTTDPGSVRLEIRDEGKGIAADQVEQVFQPFLHGADSRGAGLGLAIVRQVTTEHGGEVWAEAGPGGRLFVRLPLADAEGDHEGDSSDGEEPVVAAAGPLATDPPTCAPPS